MNTKVFIIVILFGLALMPTLLLVQSGSKEIGSYSENCLWDADSKVAYVNKTIDEPIAELNGHTLREVFEDGNLVSNSDLLLDVDSNNVPDGFGQTGSNINKELIDGIFGFEPTIQYGSFSKILTDIIGHTYYTVASVKTVDNSVSLISYSPTDITYHSGNGSFEILSFISEKTGDNGSIYIQKNSNTNFGNMIYVDYVKKYDLTDLGISPTTDMDYYYLLYEARKNITKKVLTYADIFEIYNVQSPYNDDYIYFDEYISDNKIDSLLDYYNTKSLFSVPCPYVHKTPVTDDIDGYDLGELSLKNYFDVFRNPFKAISLAFESGGEQIGDWTYELAFKPLIDEITDLRNEFGSNIFDIKQKIDEVIDNLTFWN